MIAAGSLKYKLIFKSVIEVQSASGFVTKSKEDLFTVKAAKLKSEGELKKDAKELFYSKIITFKIRYNRLVNTDLIIEYNNDEYRIISIDENKYENSLILDIEKINS